uniref:Uncharacterized protein n=1 Tax=Caenorhabditis tropicalis TaxID=1561998 RepID=A0A1I7UBZ8_9PELO
MEKKSNPVNKKGGVVAKKASNRKKSKEASKYEKKETSKMTGASQMSSAAATSKNNTSQALSVNVSQKGKSTKSNRAKKKAVPQKKNAPSKMESVASKVEDEEDEEAPKPKPKKEGPKNDFITGKGLKLGIIEHIRNPPNYGEFLVEDEKKTVSNLRIRRDRGLG